MVGIFANNGSSWAAASTVPVNNGGTWQNAQEVWAKENGVWTKVFPAEVREPPTGEYFEVSVYMWNIVTQINSATIWWPGSDAQGLTFPAANTSFTHGSWTYYRGTSKGSNRYGIYRIGTP